MINQVLTCKRMEQFTEYLFDKPDQVPKAARPSTKQLRAKSTPAKPKPLSSSISIPTMSSQNVWTVSPC